MKIVISRSVWVFILSLSVFAQVAADTPRITDSPEASKAKALLHDSRKATFARAPAETMESPAALQQAKDAPVVEFPLVPLTPDEIRARNENNPKTDGALTLSHLDLSTPMSVDVNVPNYYYYHGQPIPLPLDKDRLAIRVAAGLDLSDAQARSRALGIEVSDVKPTGIERWNLVTLTQPLADLADGRRKIEAALQAGSVEFASPVFKSLLLPDGWIAMAPDVLVQFKEEHGARAASALGELAAGFQIKQENFGGMANAYRLAGAARNGFEVLAAANRLAQDPRVKWAEPEMYFTGRGDIFPNDPEWGNLWGIRNTGQTVNGTAGTDDMDMDGDESFNISLGNSGVRVLIIDTGVQQNHPDINQNAGRDFTGGEADGVAGGGPVNACDNHGTAVAGCVSAHFDNGTGIVGIAPSSRVVSARCMVANLTCNNLWSGSNTWTVNALNWAVNQGILITNNSNSYGTTSDAIDAAYLNAYNNGQTHFASSGNNGTAAIAYPSSADTVNAVGNLQQDGTLNPTSQTGTGLDFSAPGTNIRATDRTGANGYNNASDYAWVNGTSFASPYAAGVAAIVKAAHPTWGPINIETAMKSGAIDLGASGYDTTFGWGFVNAYRSITIFGPSNDECTNAYAIPGTFYNPGSIFTYNATVSNFYEPDESCEAGNVGVSNSVWYSYTPPGNGTIDLNTWGSNYDTVLSVFDGCGAYIGATQIWFPTQLACNDDVDGTLQSRILGLPVNGGQTYMIKVSDYDTTSEGGELFVDLYFFYSSPPNDHCFNRLPIPGTAGTHNMTPLNTTSATVSPGDCYELSEAGCGHPSGNSNSVFYSFIPQVSGTVTMDTYGSDYDTVLTLYNGTAFANPCGDGNGEFCMGPDDFGYYICNDDSAGGYQSFVTQPVTVGHTFVVRVSDYNPDPGGGWLFLNVTLTPPPPEEGDVNDDGIVSYEDLPYMVDVLIDPANCPPCNLQQADMNDDGFADGKDLQLFVNAVLAG
ncbi:MAG TPA: S8 family serine peptidase [Phycisphaerae bacterium]|nr:S8 family serine peptidase [Phycisphaerae bacterium]